MYQKFIVIIFIGIVFLPVALTVLGKWGQKNYDIALHDNSGIVYVYPDLNFENYANGSFQSEFESAWNANFTGHGILTRTYNQIRFSLFHVNRPVTEWGYDDVDIIVGKNDNLYEYTYIDEYLGLSSEGYDTEEKKEQLEYLIHLLEDISDKMNLVDKDVIFLTSPNKCEFAYEDIPECFKYGEGKIRAIDVFEGIAEESDIKYVNGSKIAEGYKEELPIFYNSGIHWGRPIEQLVCSEVIQLFGDDSKKIKLGELHESSRPFWRDDDLWLLLNIWEKPKGQYYQYDETVVVPEQPKEYRVLIQGGSFAEGLQKMLIDSEAFSQVQYINYANALYNMDNVIETRINQDWNNLDWKKMLDNTDILVIEVNDRLLGRHPVHYSFCEYLNNFLDTYINIK